MTGPAKTAATGLCGAAQHVISAGDLRQAATHPLAYTVATLVTRKGEYAEMLASFAAAGFDTPDCEFIEIDNTGVRQLCAFEGLNAALNTARGRHIILCHQDVRLTHDTRADLNRALSELDRRDPAWALAGNAGGTAPGKLAIRISDPHGKDQRVGYFPARGQSLDENFIVVRANARIGFSHDLSGFHLYGADICQMAEVAGHTAYVIDFHLTHLSPGRRDHAFALAEAAFERKWHRALAPRWVQTTCTLLRLDGARSGRLMARLAAPAMRKLTRRWFAFAKPAKARS